MIDLPLAVNILGQEVVPADLAIIGLLIVLEGLLSIDNALVLGMLVKRLPKHMRARALSYGLIGAFVFRVIAILAAGFLLKYTFVKFLGGAYLAFIAIKHLWDSRKGGHGHGIEFDAAGQPIVESGDSVDGLHPDTPIVDDKKTVGLFWRTVLIIELTDIAFAVDSILAAIALAGSRTEKLWVVITGGIIGVVLMRFAAVMFVRLLERFPRFELAAYLLVLVIGLKLLADWAFNSDWSFAGTQWLGDMQPWFQSLEDKRVALVHAYEGWLANTWPLGLGEHAEGVIKKAPKLLDFHDFRRPECSGFWLVMLSCFGIGFLPKHK